MFLYRPLMHSDYEDIVKISQDIWEGADYLPDLFHRWVDDQGVFLGAVDEKTGRVIGVGKFSILYDGSGWLEGLRVHKEYRGRGIAKEITKRLFSTAKNYLKEKKINKIALATHISNVESIHMMKNLNFELKQQHITITKEYSQLNQELHLHHFDIKEWKITYEEFKNLPYLRKRNNLLPLAFVFQEPTVEFYNELRRENSFVVLNGVKGIFKFKGEPNFISVEDHFEGINTFMNYYLLKFKDIKASPPITTILPKNETLIQKLKSEHFSTWNNWNPDYFYFVYNADQ